MVGEVLTTGEMNNQPIQGAASLFPLVTEGTQISMDKTGLF